MLQANNYDFPEIESPAIYIVSAGEEAKKQSIILANELRVNGVTCETDLLGRSIKAQMKDANRLNARYVTVIGDDEIKTGKVKIKRMSDGSEQETGIGDIKNYNFI